MEKDQQAFKVMGYSFLKANQIDTILQEIMATHWYSQWLPKNALTIRAEMRPCINQNCMERNEVLPLKRAINFSLDIDKSVAAETVKQIIVAFSDAFIARMRAMLHGAKPDPFEPIVAVPVNGNMKKRQPSTIIWERYPIKTLIRNKIH